MLRAGGFRFYMWPNDHRPAHVHVEYAGEVAVIEIESLAVREGTRMRVPDIARALELVLENRLSLLNQWRKLHA